jgi:predicted dienelactone hydrolase
MSGAPASAGRPTAASLSFPVTTDFVKDQPVFHVTHPTDLAQPGGLLPVVVWANGGCFRSDFTWMPLFERWASAGFVVLTLTGGDNQDDIAAMLQTTTKAEHKALVDWVTKANDSGPYAGKLDLKRIVVAGNSCGGVTALETAAEDKRLAAVFVLSGSSAVGSVNTQVMKAINIPVGYVVGGSDDIAGANAEGDYAAMTDGVPAMIVHRSSGDHMTVSTDEKVLPQVAELALNWMDLALYGTKGAYEALTSANVCEHCNAGEWKLESKHLETLQK